MATITTSDKNYQDIADAIRAKSGDSTAEFTPSEMSAAIMSLSAEGTGSDVELDATLSIEGKAADAKAVGDAIAAIPDEVYYGTEEPTDENHPLWVDLSGIDDEDVMNYITALQTKNTELENKCTELIESNNQLKSDNQVLFSSIMTLESKLSEDYVVEQSTSGNWTWVKYNSGRIICFGRIVQDSTYNVDLAYGSLFYKTVRFPLPLTLQSVKSVNATVYHSSGLWGASVMEISVSQIGIYLYSATSMSNVNPPISFYIEGTWK